MKKGNLFNSVINEVISKMGHTDMIVVGDSGLPIPNGVKRIDLALTKGIPGFMETLEILVDNLEVEAVILASEIKENNIEINDDIEKLFPNLEIQYVNHEDFKSITSEAKAIIRTGECTPYANIILKSGVIF